MQEIINEGWVKLHRKILKSDMWKALTAMQRDLVITVMLKANHKPKRWEWEGKVYNCKEGEFITSIDSLIKPCAKGTSVQNVRTGLKKLEKWDFLTSQATKTGRKICIINWHTYQITEEEVNKETNGQLTDSQQTANGQLTTNKNVKNVENVENVENVKEVKGLALIEKNNQIELSTKDFEALWLAYPKRDGRKVGKAEALKKYLKLKDVDIPLLTTAVYNLAKSDTMPKDFHRFIKDRNGEPYRDWVEVAEPERNKGIDKYRRASEKLSRGNQES